MSPNLERYLSLERAMKLIPDGKAELEHVLDQMDVAWKLLTEDEIQWLEDRDYE